ncbi:MAG TPA: hypothetical protein VME67_11640 [Mycobacterium sp.]|nr:hypothetical protein [Mycobacterium sp.]HTX95438.1 hypothetical protein [Mycobacterium sp.]
MAGVLICERFSITKHRDFREGDLVGRSPKVAQRPFWRWSVLPDFTVADETTRSTPAT